jgi:hypothetical protein
MFDWDAFYEARRTTEAERCERYKLAADLIDACFPSLAKMRHPDVGGSNEAMHALERARDYLHDRNLCWRCNKPHCKIKHRLKRDADGAARPSRSGSARATS